jgi:hypothetical protein
MYERAIQHNASTSMMTSLNEQDEVSFTLQLKVLGKELDVDVLYSDDRHSLIDRLCENY